MYCNDNANVLYDEFSGLLGECKIGVDEDWPKNSARPPTNSP